MNVNVKATPAKGRANEAVVALLAERLRIDALIIAVVSGRGSPAKVVEVDGMDDEAITAVFSHQKPEKSGRTRT